MPETKGRAPPKAQPLNPMGRAAATSRHLQLPGRAGAWWVSTGQGGSVQAGGISIHVHLSRGGATPGPCRRRGQIQACRLECGLLCLQLRLRAQPGGSIDQSRPFGSAVRPAWVLGGHEPVLMCWGPLLCRWLAKRLAQPGHCSAGSYSQGLLTIPSGCAGVGVPSSLGFPLWPFQPPPVGLSSPRRG